MCVYMCKAVSADLSAQQCQLIWVHNCVSGFECTTVSTDLNAQPSQLPLLLYSLFNSVFKYILCYKLHWMLTSSYLPKANIGRVAIITLSIIVCCTCVSSMLTGSCLSLFCLNTIYQLFVPTIYWNIKSKLLLTKRKLIQSHYVIIVLSKMHCWFLFFIYIFMVGI